LKSTDLVKYDSFYVNDPVQSQPWKVECEIDNSMLEIGLSLMILVLLFAIKLPHIINFSNKGNGIDQGEFGIVYKGKYGSKRVKSHYSNRGMEVAVKTHKGGVGVEEFKALLSELKIVAYIGTHNLVVSFLGAVTPEIF